MTTADLTHPDLSAKPQAAGAAAREDWKIWSISLAIVLVMYLLLQNRYWVPGGDSEVYTTVARNLASGKGFTFNGEPVSMVPPGWPWAMAAAMKIWPTFLFLKLITMTCMLGSLAIMYWILRRFAPPKLCGIVIVLSGFLSHVYSLTFWLHSDALFCLLSSTAMLLAMQIVEGRPARRRMIALFFLGAAAVTVRWAGLLTWLLVAAILLQGEFIPRFNDRWVRAFALGLICMLTFLTLRSALTVSPETQQKISEFGGMGDDPGTPIGAADKTLAVSYQWINPASGGIRGYFARASLWGNWFAQLLWQPLRLSSASGLLNLFSLAVGWLALAMLFLEAWLSIHEKQWLWLGMVIYSLGLAINWPHPSARYLVPIAPLIILAVFKGIDDAPRLFAAPAVRTICRVLLWCFVISYVLCNGALYAVDVYVARSSGFYDEYEAGIDKDLIYACHWLNSVSPRDGEIAVSERYVNMGHTRISRFGLRATTMLTGKAIVSLPLRYTRLGDPRSNAYFIAWARQMGIKYLLYQPDVSPWRVFHFRMGWLQKIITHEDPVDTGAGWRVYQIPPTGNDAIRVSLDPYTHWPTRVPGM